jgi:hypothetical protein
VPRASLPGITLAINGTPQACETTIGTVGGSAVIVASALPELGITLTSSYLAAMVGDIAASHLCSAPGGPPIIDQHVLPGDQPGQTHAQTCLLDHVAELRDTLDAYHASDAIVTADIADVALEHAQRAWGDDETRTD